MPVVWWCCPKILFWLSRVLLFAGTCPPWIPLVVLPLPLLLLLCVWNIPLFLFAGMLILFLWFGILLEALFWATPEGYSLLMRLIMPPICFCFFRALGVINELFCAWAPDGVFMGLSADVYSPLRAPYLLPTVVTLIVWRLIGAPS